MKKNNGYMTRALKAKDPRYARILEGLGYSRTDLQAVDEKPLKTPKPDEMTMLRAEYERALGKRAFNGWKADQLREKISAAKAEG